MSDRRIASRWQALQRSRRVALIPYLTAGYPSRDQSLAALRLAAGAGADFVEVGIPFSDPLADGPTIQQATQVALEQGMTTGDALALIQEARLEIPVIAFSYLNPLLAYGLPRFVRDARAAGVSGVLVTDLPAGEDRATEEEVRAGGLDLIRLVAPTTSGERLKRVLAGAQGFVYLIARLGVTGPRTVLGPELQELVRRVRAATPLPLALGFGIGTAEQARAAAGFADGIVVGSALLKRLAHGPDAARELLMELRAALDTPLTD